MRLELGNSLIVEHLGVHPNRGWKVEPSGVEALQLLEVWYLVQFKIPRRSPYGELKRGIQD